MTHCTRPLNYLTVPSLAVPAGFTANGLPAGFQLAGRPFGEALLFSVAAAYEAATDWTSCRPALG
jgi:aspartyl-tRNA(Asn)/glutamyl-tRNA(Gln) amidotransferase subunit A